MPVRLRVSGLLLLSLLVPLFAVAQDAPPPWVRLEMVQVDPTMVDEFVAVQQELMEIAKKAKVPWRRVSRTEVFGDAYRFLIASPVQELASFDRTSDDPALERLMNRYERCVTSSQTYGVYVLYDFSSPLPEAEQPSSWSSTSRTSFPDASRTT